MTNLVRGSSVFRPFCMANAVLALSWFLCNPGIAETTDAPSVAEWNRGLVEMITNGDDTSVRMAQELAAVIDDGATRRVLQLVGRGGKQNLIDLQFLRGVDIGIVHTDVLEAVKRQRATPTLESSITYISKLYNEELHVLVLNAVGDIAELEGKRVSFASTAAYSGPAIFDLLKIKIEVSSDDPLTSLQKLKAGEISAIVYVAGKPSSTLRSLRKEDGLHLLSVPLKPEMLALYFPARFTADEYPNLIPVNEVVDTVAVGAVMVVAALQPKTQRYRNVAAFVDAFFTQFPRLQEAGHDAKWREVNLATDLPGWKRFAPAETWLQRNAVAPTRPLNEQELREVFAKFLDERNRLSGGRAMSSGEKAQMVDKFLQWQKSQAR